MKLIAHIRLNPTPEQHAALLVTLAEANAACDAVSLIAWQAREFRRIPLQKISYHQMNTWEALPEIERDPQTVSGAWVFRGTRVPVTALFENLRDGATIEQFLEWFPGVTSTQIQAVLDHEALRFSATPTP